MLWDIWWMNSFRLLPQSGNIFPTFVPYNDSRAILRELRSPKKKYNLVLSTVKPTLLAAQVLRASPEHLVTPETAEIVDDKTKLATWMMNQTDGLQERVPRTVSWSEFVAHPDDNWIKSNLGGFPIIVSSTHEARGLHTCTFVVIGRN